MDYGVGAHRDAELASYCIYTRLRTDTASGFHLLPGLTVTNAPTIVNLL